MSDLKRRTVGGHIAAVAERLGAAGIDEPRLEAQILLCHALGLDRAALLCVNERHLNDGENHRLEHIASRRSRREPMAYILGEREFWSLSFRLGPDVLIPRPDSETVVEAVLTARPSLGGEIRILDLGTGSGCLLLALLSEFPEAEGIGTDASSSAIALARVNARRLGLDGRARFVCADWGSALAERFDVIVANPPYVPEGVIDDLAREIARYEPRLALSSGEDGLDRSRELAPHVAGLLAATGLAVVEIGAGQAGAVSDIFAEHGLVVAERRRDLAGVERCVVFVHERTGSERVNETATQTDHKKELGKLGRIL